MKPRSVFVGLLGGLLASQILSIVFREVWPGYIASQFKVFDANSILGYAASALLILVSGYAAARLEWSRHWGEAMLQGACASLLGGCLAYLLSSAPAAAGMMGQKEILLSIARPISGEKEGMTLLLQGVVNTAVWSQVVFWAILLASILLGGLGGLLSRLEGSGGWGKAPAPKAPHLPRMAAYTVGFFAVVNVVITVVVLSILPQKALEAVQRTGATSEGLLLPPWAILTLPLITGMAFVAVCLVLSTLWAFQGWGHPEERLRVRISLVILGLLMLTFFLVSYQLALLVVAILAVIGIITWAIQRRQAPAPDNETGNIQPYSGLDLLASALTQGILSAALTMGSMVAYALALVLIAIVDIVHLMNTAEPFNSTAQQQISSLYVSTISASVATLVIASVIGLILAGIGVWTGILRAAPKPQFVETPLPNAE
jgi:hypothetical protein